jgi:hypothetical protein
VGDTINFEVTWKSEICDHVAGGYGWSLVARDTSTGASVWDYICGEPDPSGSGMLVIANNLELQLPTESTSSLTCDNLPHSDYVILPYGDNGGWQAIVAEDGAGGMVMAGVPQSDITQIVSWRYPTFGDTPACSWYNSIEDAGSGDNWVSYEWDLTYCGAFGASCVNPGSGYNNCCSGTCGSHATCL